LPFSPLLLRYKGNSAPTSSGSQRRAEELAAISARAADAARGRPSVVSIDGVPGVGKTVLLRAAVAALPPGFAVLRAEAAELASDIPFEVVSQLGEVAETAPFPVAVELLGIWGAVNGGGPVAVEGTFFCYRNLLVSLEHAPRSVGRDFSCSENLLVSLQGAPIAVGGSYFCQQNKLDSLAYAPAEIRGEFRPIATNVPGIDICEHMPRLARMMDKVTLIRSLVGFRDDHNTHWCSTGWESHPPMASSPIVPGFPPGDSPSLGSVPSCWRMYSMIASSVTLPLDATK